MRKEEVGWWVEVGVAGVDVDVDVGVVVAIRWFGDTNGRAGSRGGAGCGVVCVRACVRAGDEGMGGCGGG